MKIEETNKHSLPSSSFLLTTNNLHFGGVEQVILTYAKHLSRAGHRVTVACLNPGQIANEIAALDDVGVIHVQSKIPLLRFLHFLRVARTTRPRIVHNHACWYGLLVGRLTGAKCVETVHNMYNWFRFHEKILYGFYCMLAHRIVACSRFVEQYTIDHFPFMNARKFVTIHSGIDIAQFTRKHDRTRFLKRYSVDGEKTIVGFVGRLAKEKGVHLLLECARRLLPQRPDIQFVVVGDGPMRDQLEAQKNEHGLHNVHLVGRSTEIPQFLSAFDMYVLPSALEGFPIGILEALASGLPVIASRVSGVPEAVTHGENGFLIDAGDVAALTERIVTLTDNPDLRMRMSSNARTTVEQQFADRIMIRKSIELYQEILA